MNKNCNGTSNISSKLRTPVWMKSFVLSIRQNDKEITRTVNQFNNLYRNEKLPNK
ncbi:MAG TPA: hypothetical protein QF753_00350 [Victivallales bacterium]|nr:hypothetical protein [Victivallales bacterium]